MNKSKLSIFFLCLSLQFTNAQLVWAKGENNELPKFSRAHIPIGSIESMGALIIDGRLAKGQEPLWGSELIQAPANASARISLHSIGQASLNPASIVRMTTMSATNDRSHPTLIASIVKGSLQVKLQPEAMAYLSAGKTSFIASEGANFMFEMREGEGVVHASSGNVASLGQWTVNIPPPVIMEAERFVRMQEQAKSRRYFIKPYNLSSGIDVRARSQRQLQFRVTDENDRPVPDLPIVFALTGNAPEGIGSLNAAGLNGMTVSANTNVQGIATVTFTAKGTVGFVPISASVPGATAAFSGTIYVSAAAVFWTMATALPVLATAAAATVAGVTVAATQNKTQPVSATLPAPVIKP